MEVLAIAVEDLSKGGVYVIRNTVNGKRYVGSAVCFKRRWKHHRQMLKAGCHDNQYLQRAWVKYGAEAFVFEVLELVDNLSDILGAEQKWMDEFDVCNRAVGYNMQPYASSSLGRKASGEARARLAEIGRKRWAAGWRFPLRDPRAISEANSKTYVVVDPNGKHQVVKNLRQFCQENDLGYTGVNLVATKRNTTYKGWFCELATPDVLKKLESGYSYDPTSWKPRWEGQYILTSPKGEKLIVDNLTGFCRQKGLETSGMQAVLSGRCHHYKGWQCRYATQEVEELGKNSPPKLYQEMYRGGYIAIDPEGRLHEVYNLSKFCKEYGLDHSTMRKVAQGRCQHNRYWRCEYLSEELLVKARSGERLESFTPKLLGRKYLLVDPQGKEYEIFNLNGFCKEYNLNQACLQRVVSGKYSQHKGWKGRYLDGN